MAKVKPVDAKSTLVSWADADNTLQDLSALYVEKNKNEAEMNDELQKVQQKYQPLLDKINSDIIGKERNLELYCNENKSEFEAVRTKQLNFGEIGYRKGTGKLATLKGFTWESVLNIVKKSKKLAEKYVRTKTELAKDKILSDNLSEKELANIGCLIKQDDVFFCDAYLKESKAV